MNHITTTIYRWRFFNHIFNYFSVVKGTRIDLGGGAISLGLSCTTDKQCQLSDPYSYCNLEGKCDCTNVGDASLQGECGADKPGCADGTFQCRSTGICISWFFVCDGR